MITDKVLYFPYIRVPRNDWFTRVLLYWDEIGSIIPSEYAAHPETLGPYMQELLAANLVRPIIPSKYVSEIPNFTEAFLQLIDENIHMVSPRRSIEHMGQTSRIHIEKTGNELGRELIDRGLARMTRYPWYEVESLTANLFMAYLASTLGRINTLKMQPITYQEQSFSLFVASEQKTMNSINALADLRIGILEAILPAPCGGIPVAELLEFKQKNHHLLSNFRRRVESKLIESVSITDQELREDYIRNTKEELVGQIEKITSLMEEHNWPTILAGALAAVFPIVVSVATNNYLGTLSGLPPLAYAVCLAYKDKRVKQEAILKAPLAYAALAQKKFDRSGNISIYAKQRYVARNEIRKGRHLR